MKRGYPCKVNFFVPK